MFPRRHVDSLVTRKYYYTERFVCYRRISCQRYLFLRTSRRRLLLLLCIHHHNSRGALWNLLTMTIHKLALALLGILAQSDWFAAATGSCEGLIALSLENTTILSTSRVAAGSNVSTPGSCQHSAVSTVAVCRVFGMVDTTEDSAVKFEMWLPDTWYGRFLGVGNGGLGGCELLVSFLG